MPLHYISDEPRLGIWKTEETAAELLSMLSRKDDYRPFLEKTKNEGRRREWLSVRLLLRTLLGEEVLIAYHSDGAPYLPEKEIAISISHTKGYAAVLLSENSPVGIDIEQRADRILKVRHRYLSPEENRFIDNAHERDHLLISWCAKETLIKMTGLNDADLIEELHVEPFTFKQSGQVTVYETRTATRARFRLRFAVEEDYVLTYSMD